MRRQLVQEWGSKRNGLFKAIPADKKFLWRQWHRAMLYHVKRHKCLLMYGKANITWKNSVRLVVSLFQWDVHWIIKWVHDWWKRRRSVISSSSCGAKFSSQVLMFEQRCDSLSQQDGFVLMPHSSYCYELKSFSCSAFLNFDLRGNPHF